VATDGVREARPARAPTLPSPGENVRTARPGGEYAGAPLREKSLIGQGDARTATVRDLVRIVRLSDPHFSPDGKTVAVVETRANVDVDEFESEIVLVDVASGQTRPLTRARHHATSPRWSCGQCGLRRSLAFGLDEVCERTA
jgi:hypothetical protein